MVEKVAGNAFCSSACSGNRDGEIRMIWIEPQLRICNLLGKHRYIGARVEQELVVVEVSAIVAHVCRQKHSALHDRGNGWVFVWFIKKVGIFGIVEPKWRLSEVGAGIQRDEGATGDSLVAAANRIEFNGRRTYRTAVDLLNLRQIVANVCGVSA